MMIGNVALCFGEFPYTNGLRYLYTAIGRMAEKWVVVFSHLKIDGVVTPALTDRTIAELLGLDAANQLILYSITFGDAAHQTGQQRDRP